MIRRTVLEWKTLYYGDGEDRIPRHLAERILAEVEKSAFPESVFYRQNGLQAGGVAGVIVAPGIELEILPKISADPRHPAHQAGNDHIRANLVHMLATVLDIQVADGDLAHLGTQKMSLLEVLIRIFSQQLCLAVRHGLPRQYVEQANDLPALRGRLNITRQFSTLGASPQKLACRYEDLLCDIPLNQILKAAITRLLHLARTAENQRRLRELSVLYADVSAVPVAALRWDKVQLDRTTTRWKPAFTLAKLLLGQQFQTTSSGMTQGFSLLFEMHVLFEKYIACRLHRALAGTSLRVVSQAGRRYALFTQGGRGVFQTIPDMIIKEGNRIVQIIDTKWKSLAPRWKDPRQNISQADIYQMMAYARIYGCPTVTLLYPHAPDLEDGQKETTHTIASPDSPDILKVMTVNLSDIKNLTSRLRQICGCEGA